MVVAMFLGMGVLGIPAGWAMGLFGTSWHELTDDAPALMLLAMVTTMTVPMVGWMAYRGHGLRANAEMSASMYLPTFAVIGLLGAAAMALAVPISGVFASDGGSSSGGSRPSAVQVQDGGGNTPAPRRHNCPHRGGGQGGGSSSSDTSLQQF
jgi:hypothetical protein